MRAAVRVVEQVKDQRGGDVVGQVAHQPEWLGCQGAEIKAQGIALDQMQPGLVGKPLAKAGGQVTVDLDGREPITMRQQSLGQRGLTGSDFDDVFPRARVDGLDDVVDHMAVGEEVLAEAFARGMHQRASSAARASAARKLPGSARPWPAISKAVP